MPREKTQSEELSERRKREILEAAVKLFVENGYNATTIDHIAKSIGTTKGLIYYYFLNKEEILFSIQETATLQSIEKAKKVLEQDLSSTERIWRMMIGLGDDVSSVFGASTATLQQRYVLGEKNKKEIRSLQRQYEQIIKQVIRDGISSGEFIKCNELIISYAMITAITHISNWIHRDGKLSLEQIVKESTTYLIRGLLPGGSNDVLERLASGNQKLGD